MQASAKIKMISLDYRFFFLFELKYPKRKKIIKLPYFVSKMLDDESFV